MRYWGHLGQAIQTVDFGFLVPAMARMPLSLGAVLAGMRGAVWGLCDYEWRSLALGEPFVRQKTYQAMRALFPEAGRSKWLRATVARFMNNSLEEWEACLFPRDVMKGIARRSVIEGLPEYLNLQKQGRGLVLVSCHFGSFCMGMVLLGMAGVRTNVINTAEIEDPRIHPVVRSFFQRKYRAMEQRMRGRMPYFQTEFPFFYKALERGETVVLMGDPQGSKSTVHIPFLGRSFRMPLGAWHLARKTNSLLGAYVCLRQSPGRYRLVSLPPREVGDQGPREALEPIYAFLDTWIRKKPEPWVAADLWASYAPLAGG